MARLHLFELEDLHWFPRIVRDYATDYLQFIEHRMQTHRPVTPLLAKLIRDSDTHTIVDLCSGGAGPMVALVEALRHEGIEVRVVLTDMFPNLGAFEDAARRSGGAIDYVREPVDARAVPPAPAAPGGIRTVFNAFHHFTPHDGRAIIRGAVEARQPIAIFEIPQRSLPMVLATLLAPLMVLLSTPFIRPFRWRRLLLTYVLPLVPLTCLWDGVVSQLRAYRADELEQLARECSTDYAWTAGVVPVQGAPLHLTYLVGSPGRPAEPASMATA